MHVKDIKVKNGMQNFRVKTSISSWHAQLFSFVQGYTENFRDDNPGHLTAFLLSATTCSPFALLDQEHRGAGLFWWSSG